MDASEKLAQKERELRDLVRMKEYSGNLVAYLEDLSAKFEVLNEGSAVVAKVCANWDRVFGVMATADQHTRLVQTDLRPEDDDEARASASSSS